MPQPEPERRKVNGIDVSAVVGGLFLLIAMLIGIWLFMEGENHNIRTADSHAKIKTEELISILTQTEMECRGEENKKDSQSCEQAYKSLMNHATLHDLLAQETVAKATRMLMWSAIVQAIASMLTISLLVWTIGQAYGLITEARNTTEATNNALTESKAANALQLKPYLSVENVEVEHIRMDRKGPDGRQNIYNVVVKVRIKNTGSSVALNVSRVYFEELQCELAESVPDDIGKGYYGLSFWGKWELIDVEGLNEGNVRFSGFISSLNPQDSITLTANLGLTRSHDGGRPSWGGDDIERSYAYPDVYKRTTASKTYPLGRFKVKGQIQFEDSGFSEGKRICDISAINRLFDIVEIDGLELETFIDGETECLIVEKQPKK